eukprot:6603744-Prymnesium_polylepis.1
MANGCSPWGDVELQMKTGHLLGFPGHRSSHIQSTYSLRLPAGSPRTGHQLAAAAARHVTHRDARARPVARRLLCAVRPALAPNVHLKYRAASLAHHLRRYCDLM